MNVKRTSYKPPIPTTDGLPLSANAVQFVNQHSAKVMKDTFNKKLHAAMKPSNSLARNLEAICNRSGTDTDDRVMPPPESANEAGAEFGLPTREATEQLPMVRGRLNTVPVKLKRPQLGNTLSETPPLVELPSPENQRSEPLESMLVASADGNPEPPERASVNTANDPVIYRFQKHTHLPAQFRLYLNAVQVQEGMIKTPRNKVNQSTRTKEIRSSYRMIQSWTIRNT